MTSDPLHAGGYLALHLAWQGGLVAYPYPVSFSNLIYIPMLWSALVIALALHRSLLRRQKINWKEQVAVVTGSSGGLGSAIVNALLQNGCRVVAVDIAEREGNLEGSDYLFIKADVSKMDDFSTLPAKIKEKFGRDASIVISNAGVMIGRRVLDFERDQFERTIAINFIATYYAVRTFLPAMLSSGRGHIVATSSIMGYVSISQLTDYVASKHALIGFIESLRFELDKKYKAPKVCTTLLILGKLSTPLFARTTISFLSQFFQPTQDPKAVAKALINHLERESSGRIYRPYLAYFAPLLKAMPDWIRNVVQWASGADEALQPSSTDNSTAG